MTRIIQPYKYKYKQQPVTADGSSRPEIDNREIYSPIENAQKGRDSVILRTGDAQKVLFSKVTQLEQK